MKTLQALGCIALLVASVSCSRDPDVIKRKYVESGNRYFERGKFKEARIMYRNAIRKDPAYGDAHYRLGLAELKLGQQPAAYESFLRAIRRDPNNVDALVQAARMALAGYLQNPARSRRLAEQTARFAAEILKLQPDSTEGLRLRGYCRLIAENKPLEALADFRRANGIRPLQPEIVLPLVETLYSPAVNRPAEAEKMARELLAKEKAYLPMYELLYAKLARAGRLAEAEELLKTEIRNNPASHVPLIRLAAHYQRTGRAAEAKKVIDGLASNPKFPEGRLEAGRFYFRLGDFAAARRYFEEGVKAGGENKARFQKEIVQVFRRERRPEEAKRVLDDILRQDPDDEEAKALRTAVRIETGDPAQIQLPIDDLESAIRQAPKSPVLRLNYGLALIARRQFDQAQAQLEEAIRLNPAYVAARLALAGLHHSRGDFGGARQEAREILEKVDPENLPAMLLEANALAAAGERDAARRLLADIIREHPGSPEARIQLALLDLAERKYEAAEASFTKLYKANPADARALIGMAETYSARGRYDQAIGILEKELDETPGRQQIRAALAGTLFKAGRIDGAIGQFQQLIRLNPKSGDLYFKLAECYRARGDLKDAIAAYEKARDLQPADPAAHLQLAMLYDGAGRREEARPAYEQVLKLQPDNAFALNNLAYIMAETGGDLDQALALAQRAKQHMPENPDVSDTLAWIYIKKNLNDNAVRILRQLVSRQPDRSTFRYHLGLALGQKGDRAGARRELSAALARRPSKDEEAKIRELLEKIG